MLEVHLQNKKQALKDILWVPALLMINVTQYYGARFLEMGRPHIDLTTAWDLAIPFIPWTVAIYWGCFLMWVFNFYLGVTLDKGNGWRFLIAYWMADFICAVVFVIMPSTMYRPPITGTTIWDWVLSVTYTADAADNLCPSVHVFFSWMCWIVVRNHPKIPKWYQWLSLTIAIAVCISILTVKQHVLIDIPTGIAVAELSYFVAKFIDRKLPRRKGFYYHGETSQTQ